MGANDWPTPEEACDRLYAALRAAGATTEQALSNIQGWREAAEADLPSVIEFGRGHFVHRLVEPVTLREALFDICMRFMLPRKEQGII